jgi:drug/metabolite transporter (DMT)-like permease
MTVYAYRGTPLSLGTVLEATGYIYVTVFGVTIFKEKINIKKILALILIISGIAVFALAG